MNQRIKQHLGVILPLNQKIKRIIEAIIIILIVADIIVLTSLYFINVSPKTYDMVIIFDTGLCVVLFVEFVLKIRLEENKTRFIRKDWIDIIAMIPYELLAFPLFRFVRLARLLRLARLTRVIVLLEKGKRNIFNFLSETKLNYALFTLFIIICAGSLAFFILEYGANPNINGLDDAIWYAIVTISTVGYGDVTPKTHWGMLIGSTLIFVGVGFFSLLTASLASWLSRSSEEKDEEIKNKIINMENSINEMKSEIKEFKELLKENK